MGITESGEIFEHGKSTERQVDYIVVEKCDIGGGILGYEVMSLAEAQKQADDSRREKMPDKMMDVLHSSDLNGEVFWRQFDVPMSKEQAEDLATIWDRPRNEPGRMTYDEYFAKWRK